jgi:hypothetical protein
MTSRMPREKKEEWISGDLLAAVMDNQRQADEAMKALEPQGIPRDSIRVYHGEDGRQEFENLGGGGLKGKALRLIEDWVANAKDLTGHLKDEASSGRYVLVVPLPDPGSEESVRRVLKDHGAHGMVARIKDDWKTYA